MSDIGLITCDAPPSETGHGPLPVYIRSGEGDVIGSGVTGTPIAVPPGRYYATVLLPDGREIGAPDAVIVASGQQEQCVAGVCWIASPQAVGVAAPTAGAAPPMASATAVSPPPPDGSANEATVTLWRGNWLALWRDGEMHRPELSAPGQRLATGSPLNIDSVGGDDQLLALPIEGGASPLMRLFIVPYDIPAGGGVRHISAQLNIAGGSPQVDFRTSDAAVNTMLAFVEANILTNMMRLTTELVKQAEAGTNVAAISTLGTITGTYILLRSNVLEGVEKWLDQVDEIDPGQPDISILRVEMLGRLGRHDDAVEFLKGMIGGRAPWFRAGLSYMLERLRLYVDVSNNPDAPFALSANDMDAFKRARNALEIVLPMMDNNRHMATFDVPWDIA